MSHLIGPIQRHHLRVITADVWVDPETECALARLNQWTWRARQQVQRIQRRLDLWRHHDGITPGRRGFALRLLADVRGWREFGEQIDKKMQIGGVDAPALGGRCSHAGMRWDALSDGVHHGKKAGALAASPLSLHFLPQQRADGGRVRWLKSRPVGQVDGLGGEFDRRKPLGGSRALAFGASRRAAAGLW